MAMHSPSFSSGCLVLEDGTCFEGMLFGAPLPASPWESKLISPGYGEAVFNTSLTGYQEILTDPSYCGQIVCMTAAHLGNTGINEEDDESVKPWCAGFIVHENCDTPSNWRSTESLRAFLTKKGIPGLCGVDTRALTRHLRSRGTLRALMVEARHRDQAAEWLKKLPSFEGEDLIREVSARKPYPWKRSSADAPRFRVIALDYGIKRNLLRCLEQQGCAIDVYPADTSAAEILRLNPHGVFLSNGPGDPSAAPYAARCVSELLGKVPIFGVCMGHQILALALGGKTYKLKFGHRGGNQPVLDRETGRVEISSHNHGYAVDGESLPSTVQLTHQNLNDKTVEGLSVPSLRAFSVQYHPESCPGPHDSEHLFERFAQLMDSSGKLASCSKNT